MVLANIEELVVAWEEDEDLCHISGGGGELPQINKIQDIESFL